MFKKLLKGRDEARELKEQLRARLHFLESEKDVMLEKYLKSKSADTRSMYQAKLNTINDEIESINSVLKKKRGSIKLDWTTIVASLIGVAGTVATTKMILNYEEEGHMIPSSLKSVPEKILKK